MSKYSVWWRVPVQLHFCWAHLVLFCLAYACMNICDLLETVNVTALAWEEWYKEAALLF